MGGWTVYCPICGLTPHESDVSIYYNSHNCSKCKGAITPDDYCEDCIYNIPVDDLYFISSVRVLLFNGDITPYGKSDWPGPVRIYDNENYYTYQNYNLNFDVPNEYQGIMIHSICFDLLNKEIQLNKLTLKQAFYWIYENVHNLRMLLKNYDYGFITKRQQQDYELFKGEEWVTRRPDKIPSLPNLNKKIIRKINWKMNKFEQVLDILLLDLYITDIITLLNLRLTYRSLYYFLSSEIANIYIWKKICLTYLLLNDEKDQYENEIFDWYKYVIIGIKNQNFKNRIRIINIVKYIVHSIKYNNM